MNILFYNNSLDCIFLRKKVNNQNWTCYKVKESSDAILNTMAYNLENMLGIYQTVQTNLEKKIISDLLKYKDDEGLTLNIIICDYFMLNIINNIIMGDYISIADLNISVDVGISYNSLDRLIDITTLTNTCDDYNIEFAITHIKSINTSYDFKRNIIELARNGNDAAKLLLDIIQYMRISIYKSLAYRAESKETFQFYLDLLANNQITEHTYITTKLQELDKYDYENKLYKLLLFKHVGYEKVVEMIEESMGV